MSERDFMMLRQKLLGRRQEIFDRQQKLESDWDKLQERQIEAGEEAQQADLSSLFDQLDDLEKREIEQIDVALHKLATGTFGECENCHQDIDGQRLQVLPETALCRHCAEISEQRQPPRG